jgi:hypothetical protein
MKGKEKDKFSLDFDFVLIVRAIVKKAMAANDDGSGSYPGLFSETDADADVESEATPSKGLTGPPKKKQKRDTRTCKRPRTDYPLETKVAALDAFRAGEKVKDVAERTKINRTTLQNWKKQAQEINKQVEAGRGMTAMRDRGSDFPLIDAGVMTWFRHARSGPDPFPVSGAILRAKAIE